MSDEPSSFEPGPTDACIDLFRSRTTNIIPSHLSDSELERRAKIAWPIHYHKETRTFYDHGLRPGCTLRSDIYTNATEEEYVNPNRKTGLAYLDYTDEFSYIGQEYFKQETGSRMFQSSWAWRVNIVTLHPVTSPSNEFKATIEQVLSQLPSVWFDIFPRMRFHTQSANQRTICLDDNEFHCRTTDIFIATKTKFKCYETADLTF